MTSAEFRQARIELSYTRKQMAAALGLGANGWRTILRIEQGANITGPMALAVKSILRDSDKPST